MTKDGVERLVSGQWDSVLALLATGTIAALLFIWPGGVLDHADHAAYAVCHRISERTFAPGGRPLPLCARCSGTYLGALAGLLVLSARGRGRTGRFPGRKYLAVVALCFLAWGIDGLNSYATFFPGVPYLYEPNNLLRLSTGTLQGMALAALLLPAFNTTVWRDPDHQPSLAVWQDLAWLGAGGLLVVAFVASEWAPVLYPLALLSGVMVVAMVGAVNSMLLFALLRREGRAARWRDAVAPLAAGTALAMLELTGIGVLRAALTAHFGLPF